jgi:copper transport protein
VAVLALSVLLIVASPVLGHVDLESSSPSDGTVVTEAPELIELRFTSAAVPAGEGVVLASADGASIDATVTQHEPAIVHIVPTEPLVNGVYGVLWTVKAGDAHPKSGTITFQVDVPLPPPVEEEPTAPAPSTSGIDTVPETTLPEVQVTESPVDEFVVETGDESPASGSEESSVEAAADLDPVFEVPATGSEAGDWLARIGRWAAMTGALIGIGAFSFAATSLIGTRREVEEAGLWVQRAGLLVIAGTVIEVLGVSMGLAGSVGDGLAPSSIVDVLAGSFGVAVVLRLVGGLAMAAGTAKIVSVASTPIAGTIRRTTATENASDVAVVDKPAPTYRLDVHRERLALVGIGLVAVSFLFDGHTVTTAPNLLVKAASAVHVLAAGVWVGGVLLMAWTLASRHRRSVPLDAAAMVIRFSRIASIALAAVAIAGTALALAILDSPQDLFTTSWGRVLIVKVLAVCVAAGIGVYNHFVTVPALDTDPTNEAMADQLRRLVRIEGGILLLVVAVTAVLVGVAA